MTTFETGFPGKDELASAFFSEAARHLLDARILHHAQRYPASITSSMKAAELGMKSVLILDGALGWWDKLMTTHKPFEEISSHKILSRHRNAIKALKPDLPLRFRQLEQLEPTKPGARDFVTDNEANTEYPFVGESINTVTGSVYVEVHKPGVYFDEVRSVEAFDTALDVLTAIQTAYSIVIAWQVVLPDAL